MPTSVPSLFVAMVCSQVPSANYRTTNFEVHADSAGLARAIGDSAERWRKDLGKRWLGRDLPAWDFPCVIEFSHSMEWLEGLSDISFSDGKVASQKMWIKGPLERVISGPLPHELTHVLFAHHFGAQPPRWADEGAALLSEGERQDARQRKLFRKMLAEDRPFPLRRLLAMKEYPANLSCLYAQAHSVSGFLVEAKSSATFLTFVRSGLDRGWDEAVREQYGYRNVEHLERAWHAWLIARRASEPDQPEALAR
jgi:hypothetical protein